MKEKLEIMETEYHIQTENDIREDVSVMCNLSQGIREDGIEDGRAEAEEKVILNMHKEGYTLAQIAKVVEKSVEEVEAVIEKREPVLV